MRFAIITPDLARVDYDGADKAYMDLLAMQQAKAPEILCGVEGGRTKPPIMETWLGLKPALDLHDLARKAGVA